MVSFRILYTAHNHAGSAVDMNFMEIGTSPYIDGYRARMRTQISLTSAYPPKQTRFRSSI